MGCLFIWICIACCVFTLSSNLYLACMQVPNGSNVFGDIPKSEEFVNTADQMSHLSMCKMINLSHSNNGVKYLKLKWRRLECLASQVGGASNIFCKLFGDQKAENTFWLDSSTTEKVIFLPEDVSDT